MITFSRKCWTCKIAKMPWGGKTNQRTKMWSCASCMTKDAMKWNKGKPSVAGWYPTRIPPYTNWTNSYRWWDGSRWSWAAFPHESAEKAGRWALKKENNFVSNQMMWSEMP